MNYRATVTKKRPPQNIAEKNCR